MLTDIQYTTTTYFGTGLVVAGAAITDFNTVWGACVNSDGQVVGSWNCWLTSAGVGIAIAGAGMVTYQQAGVINKRDVASMVFNTSITDNTTIFTSLYDRHESIDMVSLGDTVTISNVCLHPDCASQQSASITFSKNASDYGVIYQLNNDSTTYTPLAYQVNPNNVQVRPITLTQPTSTVNQSATKRQSYPAGYTAGNGGGFKVLNSNPQTYYASYTNVYNWATIQYEYDSVLDLMWDHNIAQYSFGVFSETNDDADPYMMTMMIQESQFGSNWETGTNWCWGPNPTNCDEGTNFYCTYMVKRAYQQRL
jgi:hypothetical protein